MIFEHKNYRQWLKSELQSRQNLNSTYSLNAFSKRLGVSQGFLSLLFERKRSVGLKTANAIAQGLNLSPEQTEYFQLMIRLSKTSDKKSEEIVLSQMDNLRQKVEDSIKLRHDNNVGGIIGSHALQNEDLSSQLSIDYLAKPEDFAGKWLFHKALDKNSPPKCDYINFKIKRETKRLEFWKSNRKKPLGSIGLGQAFQAYYLDDVNPYTLGVISFIDGRYTVANIWVPTNNDLKYISTGIHTFELIKGKKRQLLWRTYGWTFQAPDEEILSIYPEHKDVKDARAYPWVTSILHVKSK